MPELYEQFSPQSLAARIDHTLLKAQAVRGDLEKLCGEAAAYRFKTVAVNPVQVEFCASLLKDLPGPGGPELLICAVAGFPLGQNSIAIKAAEAREAIEKGAAEIDYVVNITELKAKNYGYVEREMARIVELCREQGARSKVIFENCYLSDEEKRELCRIALAVGPDFIKTSTGFGSGGAALNDLRLMKDLVGDRIKVKAAGGIRDLDTALEMIKAGADRIGSSAGTVIVDELKARLRA
ncbi:MAG: deoxyribose-phosphate aldolase [Treponema sp.]|jgi:deoxyribose-phosphate aldolase|nr:deoxyribose-phosphate aldolase [Treponema sp.]